MKAEMKDETYREMVIREDLEDKILLLYGAVLTAFIAGLILGLYVS